MNDILNQIADWIECGPHLPNGTESITSERYMARRIRQWPIDEVSPVATALATCTVCLWLCAPAATSIHDDDDRMAAVLAETARQALAEVAEVLGLDSEADVAEIVDAARRAKVAAAPAEPPVEWIDGRTTVGDVPICAYPPNDDPEYGDDRWRFEIGQRDRFNDDEVVEVSAGVEFDEDAAKRFAIAVARAMDVTREQERGR